MPSTEPSEPVLLRQLDEHGVLLLTFNRPDRNNGWCLELEEAYFGALIEASSDSAVRVIVVTGAGRSFCPGMDIQILEQSAKSGTHSTATSRRWPMTTARWIPKPMIAAVNGACAGIGFVQMTCCDLRFAASTAKFTTAFARRGLPAENSLSWMLPRLIGTGNALDLLLSARVVLADEALQLGLVNRVYPADELLPAALAYARDLADNCSPTSMALIKQQVSRDWERSAEESRLQSLVLMSEMGAHADFSEGVMSYQEKRQATFGGYAEELKIPRSINR